MTRIIRITNFWEPSYNGSVTWIYKESWWGRKLLYKYTVQNIRTYVPGFNDGTSRASIAKIYGGPGTYTKRFMLLYNYKNKAHGTRYQPGVLSGLHTVR